MKGPVVIGGVGGSGTRVVAEMLSLMGFFIGRDLNNAQDNLSYTLLFKRPGWFLKNQHNEASMFRGFSILEKSMITREALTFKERIFLSQAVRQMAKYGHNRDGEGKGSWAYDRLAAIRNQTMPIARNYVGWGWKEPNTHLLIPVMDKYFGDFRYIHTMRHGLDMAFSLNQQQLYNWAPLFGVKIPALEHEVPAASLKYWIQANKRVIDLAGSLGSDKVLLLNFDDLCRNPGEGIRNMAGFLGVSLSDDVFGRLSELPVIPSSSGRYRNFPRDTFDLEDIRELEKLGFDSAY